MLKGKSAVVTGATSGIGLVIAKALAAEGCNLVFNGLGDSQEIENLRRGIAEDFAVKSIYHGADLRKPEDIPALIEAAEEAFGRLDILINNAGIQHVSPIETFPSDRWAAIIALYSGGISSLMAQASIRTRSSGDGSGIATGRPFRCARTASSAAAGSPG